MDKKYNYIKKLLLLIAVFSWFSGGVMAQNEVKDFYWTGGAGSWDSFTRWVNASGTPYGRAPSRYDNVIFDDNSGFGSGSVVVTMPSDATCRDIKFIGTGGIKPTLSSTRTLSIYGSSVWQSGMTVSVTNIIYEDNPQYPTEANDVNAERTITSNNVVVKANIKLKEAASIRLKDDFFQTGSTTLLAGILHTDNHNITATSIDLQSGILNSGSSEIFLTGQFRILENAIINAGTSHIYLRELYIGGNVDRTFHNLTFTNNSTNSIINPGSRDKILYVNQLEFKGGGNIQVNTNINSLILPSKIQCKFTENTQHTINESISVGANCSGWTEMQCLTEGSTATIVMANNATIVDMNNVSLQGIIAEGSNTPYPLNGSVDMGYNSGWDFNTASSRTLYWVGGGGTSSSPAIWDDPQHWSLSADGTGSGECPPGPGDDVFFNDNSGFTSTLKYINTEGPAYCRDLMFLGTDNSPAPTIKSILSGTNSPKQPLHIYGSTVWQKNMVMGIGTIIYENNERDRSIKSYGVKTGTYLLQLKENKEIKLDDDFSTHYLEIKAGIFNTDNYQVNTINIRVTGSGNTAHLILGSSQIYADLDVQITGPNVTLDAGTSHIYITSSGGSEGFQARHGQKFYDVSFTLPNTSIPVRAWGAVSDGPLIFNNLVFEGSGSLNGNMEMETLSFAANKTFSFSNGNKYTIKQRFTAGTECEGFTTITSSGSTTISMPTGAAVNVESAIMENIHAEGGAIFEAKGSLDEGNNTGWSFVAGNTSTLYWIGEAGKWNDSSNWSTSADGSGDNCVPGPYNDVVFGNLTQFTNTSKKVTITDKAFCRNMTVENSAVSPQFDSNFSGDQLNIYGSAKWQSNTVLNVPNVYFRDTRTDKTITTDDETVKVGGNVYFYESTNITLDGDITFSSIIYHYAGTWNTNGYNVELGAQYRSYNSANGTKLNLGSSHIYFKGTTFDTSNLSELYAEESHIHFKGTTTTSSGYSISIEAKRGQKFHNVYFENADEPRYRISGGDVEFDRVEFRGGGSIIGNNTFGELLFLSNKTFTLAKNSTQTITGNLTMSGTPCHIVTVTGSGGIANLNVQAGLTDFNYMDISNLNATGLGLHFEAGSAVEGNNNNLTNITYEPYDAGSFLGLRGDRLCQTFDESDPSSYTLETSGFFGNEYNTYEWRKDDDETIIGDQPTLDIRDLGPGKYSVKVTYLNLAGAGQVCDPTDEIIVAMRTPSLDAPTIYNACLNPSAPTTIADVSISGQNIKWYATDDTSTTPLDGSTVLTDGNIYYVTQTVDGCESLAVAITIKLVNCDNRVYINPMLRFRSR